MNAASLEGAVRNAAVGPIDQAWSPPAWLKSHQLEAGRRVKAILRLFGGALLSDAVGLGKTYVALAIASDYPRAVAVVPASLTEQWRRVSASVGMDVTLISYEALSRGSPLPNADLIVADEAHRLRNPGTRRYRAFLRSLRRSHLLLLTATPVVNHASDLVHLLRLFVADNAFSVLGVPSMELALSEGRFSQLTHALSAAVVARSAECIDCSSDSLPTVVDGEVIRPPPVSADRLAPLLHVLDRLQFPGMSDSHESSLLRLHLLHRLASSSAACLETARNHMAYTERALAALDKGESLSRRTSRRIFRSYDELQFALGDFVDPVAASIRTDRKTWLREKDVLVRLVRLLAENNGSSPKANALSRLLERRSGHRTIVFTTAMTTAHYLARRLRWREIVVVGTGHAWIASGKIPVHEALTMFAPDARRNHTLSPATRASILIATDFASEGLDLQDANAVIHYDLPWTPLRLEQRIGRIARLGSKHSTANVYWFAAHESIERRLEVGKRIALKVQRQLSLNVPGTSAVGRGRVINELLNRREQLGRCQHRCRHKAAGYAVVRGPLSAIVAVDWISECTCIPELITLAGDPPTLVYDSAATEGLLTELLSADASTARPPAILLDQLLEIVKARLAGADRGSINRQSKRLNRLVLSKAYTVGLNRDLRALSLLDSVLEQIRVGLTKGGEDTLEDLLSADRIKYGALQEWRHEQRNGLTTLPSVEIRAAIFGDGSDR